MGDEAVMVGLIAKSVATVVVAAGAMYVVVMVVVVVVVVVMETGHGVMEGDDIRENHYLNSSLSSLLRVPFCMPPHALW